MSIHYKPYNRRALEVHSSKFEDHDEMRIVQRAYEMFTTIIQYPIKNFVIIILLL